MLPLFSDALRLGIGMLPERRDGYVYWDEKEQVCAGCAVTTALIAISSLPTQEEWLRATGEIFVDRVRECWPYMTTDDGGLSLAEWVSTKHWNGASRESLADWIEGWEYQLGLRDLPVSEPETVGAEHAVLR